MDLDKPKAPKGTWVQAPPKCHRLDRPKCHECPVPAHGVHGTGHVGVATPLPHGNLCNHPHKILILVLPEAPGVTQFLALVLQHLLHHVEFGLHPPNIIVVRVLIVDCIVGLGQLH